jgi:hypothetical protein
MEEPYRPNSQIVANNPDDAEVLSLAQGLYGEFAGVENPAQQKNYMIMAGSAMYNTKGKREWKKYDWDTHLHKRLDAVGHNGGNQPYNEALSGQFPTDQSKRAWRRAMQVAYGLKNGTIEPREGMFYWTKQEYKDIAGTPALPNPEKLEIVGKEGKYDLYSYKKRTRKKKSE